MPPIYETTSKRLAAVRFHGRNWKTWNQKGAPPSLRFRHNYSDDELREWVPRILAMEEQVAEVHAIMNNNYSNWAPANAKRLEELISSTRAAGGGWEGGVNGLALRPVRSRRRLALTW